jgi:hypothetical protein
MSGQKILKPFNSLPFGREGITDPPLIRVYGGPLAEEPGIRRRQMEAATVVLEEAIPQQVVVPNPLI